MNENLHEAVSVYTIVEHTGVDDRKVYSIWNPSGYSFDNFQDRCCGVWRTAKAVEKYISGCGYIL